MKPAPKSLANRPIALGMFAITLSASAFLTGGTDIAMAQNPQNRARVPVSNPNQTIPTVVSDPWNDGIVDILNRKEEFAIEAFADGDSIQAISDYKAGLREVLDTASQVQHRLSWTYKMAERTLNLVDRLQALPVIDAERDNNAILLVLKSSYSMIERFYYSLDIQFWIPYFMVHHGHWAVSSVTYDLTQFESILNQYSLTQVDWFKRTLVYLTPDGVSPRYSSEFFFTVLRSVAQGLSGDLATDPNAPNPNLFPLAYAQASRSFGALAEDIDHHLAGNRVWGDDENAVNRSYSRFKKIARYLDAKKP